MFQPQVAVNAAIAAGVNAAAARPKGWSPRAIESAYRLPVARDSHRTVAVSIAFNTPRLGRYLAVYRKHYHLPPCTIVKHCLRIVNQRGLASPLPHHGGEASGWSVEATLDVSMISVACPHCHILVVEGNDNSFASLAATEDTAARLGAAVISNSYGGRESGALQAFAKAYHHPGHTIVVASGDTGFTAANFPANLASVTAVSGTALHRARNARGWRETVWRQPAIFGAAGSGCSAYVAKPAWQHDAHCPGRTVADVAAVATGVPIYEQRNGGWLTVAGTSISAPLIAGIYGLAGNAAHLRPGDLYRHRGQLFDVTAGSNSLFGAPEAACGADYLCTAKRGYDAPTGLGTPNGTGAF
jgi:subtilase family protein